MHACQERLWSREVAVVLSTSSGSTTKRFGRLLVGQNFLVQVLPLQGIAAPDLSTRYRRRGKESSEASSSMIVAAGRHPANEKIVQGVALPGRTLRPNWLRKCSFPERARNGRPLAARLYSSTPSACGQKGQGAVCSEVQGNAAMPRPSASTPVKIMQ